MKLRVIPRAPDALRYLSYSELCAFRRCRFQWWLEYVLGVRSARSSVKTRLGTLVDAAFMARLRLWAITKGVVCEGEIDAEEAIKKECRRNVWSDNDPKFGTTEDAAVRALTLADFIYTELQLDGDRYSPVMINGVCAVQISLYAPLDVPDDSPAKLYYTGGFKGKLDWVAGDKFYDGREVILDAKVKKVLDTMDLGADLQLALYQVLTAKNGHRIGLAQQVQILGKVPGPPGLTKDRKKLRCDSKACVSYDTFTAAMRRLGHTEAKYSKYIEKLRKKKFWQIVVGSAPPGEQAALWEEAMADAELMARIALSPPEKWLRGKPRLVTRAIDSYVGSKCQSCPIHSICRSTITGRPTPQQAIDASLATQEEA
jgi:hypothetical protein